MASIERPGASELEALKIMALEWVNSVRARCGAEPLAELPRGVRGVASRCVIALALRSGLQGWPAPLLVSGGVLAFARDGKLQPTVPVRDAVARFMTLFDYGEYPELIA